MNTGGNRQFQEVFTFYQINVRQRIQDEIFSGNLPDFGMIIYRIALKQKIRTF